MDTELLYLMQQAAEEGVIECPECGNTIEPDCPKCYCGWENPIVRNGYI